MTRTKFDYVVSHAWTQGERIATKEVCPPFCLESVTNEVFHFEGYEVTYQDNHFLSLKDLSTGKYIKEDDCTAFELDKMNDRDLQMVIMEAQKELKAREAEKAKLVIDQFNQAWKKLQALEEVRVSIEACGEKHFHTTVGKLKLRVLPIE